MIIFIICYSFPFMVLSTKDVNNEKRQSQFLGDQDKISDEKVVDKDLVVKRNSASAIGAYFVFGRDDVFQALCKTCRAVVATSRGNILNLHYHL